MDLLHCQRNWNFLHFGALFLVKDCCMLLAVRWKVDAKGAKISHSVSNQPILQFVSIKRRDCGEWAIPGVGGFYIHFHFLLMSVVLTHCLETFQYQWWTVTTYFYYISEANIHNLYFALCHYYSH